MNYLPAVGSLVTGFRNHVLYVYDNSFECIAKITYPTPVLVVGWDYPSSALDIRVLSGYKQTYVKILMSNGVVGYVHRMYLIYFEEVKASLWESL